MSERNAEVQAVLVERLTASLTDSWQQMIGHVERYKLDPQQVFEAVVRRVCEVEGAEIDDMYVGVASELVEKAVRRAIEQRRGKVA